jgi:hypothetical protein
LFGGDGRAEDFGELSTSCCFWFAGTICEEDVRDLDAQFVVAVENF